ncbi:MAG: FkbM family methyltransferase [Candidatus Coatesbacteria bacterium]|nr:FkbM family methyltransferase [Candidatus Coatesbacteria bacterium]
MKVLHCLAGPLTTCGRGFFRLLGLEVRRIPPFEPYSWLRERNIRTVLDIGANVGQFAAQIHRVLPDATIYSFEPLPDCYEDLVARMGQFPDFHALNLALGDSSGREQIYRNDYTPTSSLLPVDDLLVQSFPFAAQATPQEIQMRRLDDVAPELVLVEPILIKIDVQGMEDKVILGGENVFAKASILIVETSFVALYRGQALFDTIYDLLRQRGFVYMGTEHIVRNPTDGRVLQCDSLFVRREGQPPRSQCSNYDCGDADQ